MSHVENVKPDWCGQRRTGGMVMPDGFSSDPDRLKNTEGPSRSPMTCRAFSSCAERGCRYSAPPVFIDDNSTRNSLTEMLCVPSTWISCRTLAVSYSKDHQLMFWKKVAQTKCSNQPATFSGAEAWMRSSVSSVPRRLSTWQFCTSARTRSSSSSNASACVSSARNNNKEDKKKKKEEEEEEEEEKKKSGK